MKLVKVWKQSWNLIFSKKGQTLGVLTEFFGFKLWKYKMLKKYNLSLEKIKDMQPLKMTSKVV